jgi:NAD(P)-dependent dehydrogenase (short-subunit alcohol dehydrogenase family)
MAAPRCARVLARGARFVAADLTDPADIGHLLSSVGRVDVLINNAGHSWFGPTADLDVATFDALFANDVRAPYLLVAGFAPKMVQTATAASSTSRAWPGRSA